jgi:choline-sulfatase
VRIPLLFRNPTGRGSRVDTPVSLIDVAPTIVELAGVDAPPEWQGRSLARALEGEPLSSRPVVAELYMADPWSKHRLAVVHGNEKLVLDVSGGLQRFQIHEDQSEEQPIAGNLEELERILSTAGFEVDVGGLLTHEESEPTPEQREQLKALGYLDR